MDLDFVSVGEVMVQLNPLSPGPLRYVKYFEVHVAGSESNMLIGLTKLGFKTGIVTRIGDDEFGKLVLNFLRGEGVDTSRVKVVEGFPTGVYFIQRHFPVPGKSTVFYYRHGSAASTLSPEDIDEDYVASARKAAILTGITPALSDSCLSATIKFYEAAQRSNVDVVFDTNIRLKLWKKAEKARENIGRFLSSRLVFTNIEDLDILFPNTSTIDAAKKIIDKGAELVVVKLGEEGAVAVDNKLKVYRSPAIPAPFVEDVIGAGDAFNAAFIASFYRGLSIDEALLYANAAGSLTVTVRGDVEAQPSWRDLELLIESRKRALMLR